MRAAPDLGGRARIHWMGTQPGAMPLRCQPGSRQRLGQRAETVAPVGALSSCWEEEEEEDDDDEPCEGHHAHQARGEAGEQQQ